MENDDHEDDVDDTRDTVVRGPWQPTFQKIRCTAMNAAGLRCAAWAVNGATVCYTHGGAAPQVGYNTDPKTGRKLTSYEKWKRNQEVMKERLAELGEAAVERVQAILDADAEGGPLAVVKTGDQLRAAELVLDRFVPKKIEAEITQHEVHDLDREIEEALQEDGGGDAPLPPTGTDDDTT